MKSKLKKDPRNNSPKQDPQGKKPHPQIYHSSTFSHPFFLGPQKRLSFSKVTETSSPVASTLARATAPRPIPARPTAPPAAAGGAWRPTRCGSCCCRAATSKPPRRGGGPKQRPTSGGSSFGAVRGWGWLLGGLFDGARERCLGAGSVLVEGRNCTLGFLQCSNWVAHRFFHRCFPSNASKSSGEFMSDFRSCWLHSGSQRQFKTRSSGEKLQKPLTV